MSDVAALRGYFALHDTYMSVTCCEAYSGEIGAYVGVVFTSPLSLVAFEINPSIYL